MVPSFTKQYVYDTVGQLAKRLDAVLDDIQKNKAWLDTITDGVLLAAPFNASQGDLDILRSAQSDLDQLRVIYQGGATLGVAKDFRTFTKLTFAGGSHQ